MSALETIQFIRSHRLSSGRQAEAFARYLKWQIESRLRSQVVAEWIWGTRLVLRRGTAGAAESICCGLDEYETMSLVLHALRPGDLFIDAGADIGRYTILASGVCGAHSIALEATPETAALLERNLAENNLGALVTLLDAATDAPLDDILHGADPAILRVNCVGSNAWAFRGASKTLAKPSLLAVLARNIDRASEQLLGDADFLQCWYDPAERALGKGDFPGSSHALFARDFGQLASRLSLAPRRTFHGRRI